MLTFRQRLIPLARASQFARAFSAGELFDFSEEKLTRFGTVAPGTRSGAVVRPTKVHEGLKAHFKRNQERHGSLKVGDWSRVRTPFTERAAIDEAQRCLKCADAPCEKSCPSAVDVKTFIQRISTGNYYGAAKTILSDNPMGLSCGILCSTSEVCAGSCNLSNTEEGAIKIAELQEFACRAVKDMGIGPKLDDSLPPLAPAVANKPIALIGAGPGSLACATFLARMGYKNVTIFEKQEFAGGMGAIEIPEHRSPWTDIKWEVDQVEALGVKIETNKMFGRDFTLDSLKKDGFEAVFVGTGLDLPVEVDSFKELGPANNVWTSKSFLPAVCKASKPSMAVTPVDLPKLDGHVVVLGAGDVALDVATTAYRLGAERVTMVFRKSLNHMRASEEELKHGKHDLVDMMPYCQPVDVVVKDGKVSGVKLARTFHASNKDTLDYVQTDDMFTLDCDHVVTAFGSKIDDAALSELAVTNGLLDVDYSTMQSKSHDWVFGGGDVVGGGMVVEAANDGKTAAAGIHKMLSGSETEALPLYHTTLDDIDLSVTMAGVKFPNPFGLASAPPCTSIPMIKRAFDAGWGFAVTKTFVLDKDAVINVSPRIIKATPVPKGSFMNIELISEKSAEYWCKGITELKETHPENVVVGSVMAGFVKEDWQNLAIMADEAGSDIIELNLSCPHGMGEKGMGMACGEDAAVVRQISEWVTSVTNKPVFPKMTPNVTDIVSIAQACKDGNAAGVTAINTVASMMDPTPDGRPWPAVGKDEKTAYGGASGGIIRPIAMRKVSQISTNIPGFPIMATGGIDSANVAMNFLRYGSWVLQVCSAVQQQDFSVVTDLISGLQAHLYLGGRGDLIEQGWRGQSPPSLQRAGVTLPDFGEYADGRRSQVVSVCALFRLLRLQGFVPPSPVAAPFASSPRSIPTVNDIINSRIQHMGNLLEMDYRHQMIPEVHSDKCVNCGKCYMTCLDSGYQAITFNPDTHIPEVTDDCTGCALCYSVCPIPGAMTMEPRKTPYTSTRGIAPGPECPPEFLETFPPVA